MCTNNTCLLGGGLQRTPRRDIAKLSSALALYLEASATSSKARGLDVLFGFDTTRSYLASRYIRNVSCVHLKVRMRSCLINQPF